MDVVRRHDPCPWLPPGGLAEVVRSDAPAPVAVVRLLVTAVEDGALWVVPHPDGRGPGLPSAVVPGGGGGRERAPVDALAGLVAAAPPGTTPRPLGFVRNTVPESDPDYPWPVPLAHFALWQLTARRAQPQPPAPDGTWLPAAAAVAVLAERHWWPLLPS